MIQRLIAILAILYTSSLLANPAPLGIELNKSTLEDVSKKYKIISSENNINNGYYNNNIDIKGIEMDTLSKVNIISNKDKVVEGVSFFLNKSQFNSIYEALSQKYKSIKKDIPFVGSKYVLFEEDECYIEVNAPHLSFNMTVIYLTKLLDSENGDRIAKEEQEKKNQTKDML